jgi:hypothetical protein
MGQFHKLGSMRKSMDEIVIQSVNVNFRRDVAGVSLNATLSVNGEQCDNLDDMLEFFADALRQMGFTYVQTLAVDAYNS